MLHPPIANEPFYVVDKTLSEWYIQMCSSKCLNRLLYVGFAKLGTLTFFYQMQQYNCMSFEQNAVVGIDDGVTKNICVFDGV